jgi:hypothetical protein
MAMGTASQKNKKTAGLLGGCSLICSTSAAFLLLRRLDFAISFSPIRLAHEVLAFYLFPWDYRLLFRSGCSYGAQEILRVLLLLSRFSSGEGMLVLARRCCLALWLLVFGGLLSGCFYSVRLPEAQPFPKAESVHPPHSSSHQILKQIKSRASMIWKVLADDLGVASIKGQLWVRLHFNNKSLKRCRFLRTSLVAVPSHFRRFGMLNRRLHGAVARYGRRLPRRFGVCAWLKKQTWSTATGRHVVNAVLLQPATK